MAYDATQVVLLNGDVRTVKVRCSTCRNHREWEVCHVCGYVSDVKLSEYIADDSAILAAAIREGDFGEARTRAVWITRMMSQANYAL